MTGTRRSPWLRWCGRVALVVGGCLAAFLLLEGALRIFDVGHTGFRPDDAMTHQPGRFPEHRLRPEYQGRLHGAEFDVVVRTNSLGLRGPELAPAPEPTQKADGGSPARIVMLGDSFTLGWGVTEDEAFAAGVGGALAAAGAPAVVVNAGVPGYSPLDEMAQFDELADKLMPDRVVLNFYLGNDALDTLRADPAAIADPALRASFEEARKRVHVPVHLLDERLTRTAHAYMLAKVVGKRGCYALGLCAFDGDPVWNLHLDEPQQKEAIVLAGRVLDRVHEAAARRGADLLVVLLPTVAQIDHGEEGGQRVLELHTLAAGLRRWGSAAGVPVLDLEAELLRARAAHPETPLYFQYDNHWTPAGHRVAAAAIAAFLQAHPRR